MNFGQSEHAEFALAEGASSVPGTQVPGTESRVPKILLIDLENYPSQIHELQDSLDEYSRVVICYATTGVKIPLDWLIPLNDVINAGRLQIHKMNSVGKNAADFGIFFFAGMLAQKLEESAEFVIASDDTDLDHLVGLLENLSHKAVRKGKALPQPQSHPATPSVPVVASVAAGVKLYCEHLQRHSENRPATEQTLRNSIRTRMAQNVALSEAVLEQLVKLKALSLNGSKVVYQPTKISQLANTPA